MIRQTQVGEPASEWRSPGAGTCPAKGARNTVVPEGAEGVVDVCGTGKDDGVNAGDLRAGDVRATGQSAGVRAAIVVLKPGNAGGAKGGRIANSSSEGLGEERPPEVPEGDKQGGEARRQPPKAERRVWSEKMLAALAAGVKGNKWFSLIDKVGRMDTLERAWEKVQSNAGASGVDRITVEYFDKGSQKRLLALKEQIMEGSYQPQAVKRVWIPKLGSAEKRPLGIPTVRDRVVQTAIREVIEPIFEHQFAEQSYGFRPGRGCKDALRRVDELLKSGHLHVVDIDIKGYFDSIPQPHLMELVGEHIADGRMLKLIEAFLKQGVMDGMEYWEPEEGTPQGGVISPLLANIYLNPLDWLLSEAGMEMVRYADDIVVLCHNPHAAEQALELVRRWSEGAGLELHPLKTKVVSMEEDGNYFDFLGYRFKQSRKHQRVRRYLRPKSVKKLKENLKQYTRRNNGNSLEVIIAKANTILKGWFGYFQHVSATALPGLDRWVRGRLRSILRKRNGLEGRGRGIDHHKWPNRYFKDLGLFNLEEAREKLIRQSP